MKRAALYSKRTRSRDAADGTDGGQDAGGSPPPKPPGRLRPWLRRNERPVLFLGGLLGAAALAALFWAQQPQPREYTQEDIDAAVMHTFQTKTLPSQAARAAESVRQSVVRVNGFTDEPVKDPDKEKAEKDQADSRDLKDKELKDPRESRDSSKDSKDSKNEKDQNGARNDKSARARKDAQDSKGSKSSKDSRDRNDGDGGSAREPKSAKNGKDQPEARDSKSARDKDGKDSRDAQDSRPGEAEIQKFVEKRSRVGTGVVIIDNGTILTNLHVVAGAKRVTVTFSDGMEAEAVFVGAQPENDLAVIRAKQIPDDLPAATLGSSHGLRPGDEVVAVGFPFGIGPSISAGVVSGLNRQFSSPEGKRVLNKLIQFDAAVNPGNSGGPLVNMSGEVIGIVTALLNPSEQRTFIGIGFAATIESAGSAVGVPPF